MHHGYLSCLAIRFAYIDHSFTVVVLPPVGNNVSDLDSKVYSIPPRMGISPLYTLLFTHTDNLVVNPPCFWEVCETQTDTGRTGDAPPRW